MGHVDLHDEIVGGHCPSANLPLHPTCQIAVSASVSAVVNCVRPVAEIAAYNTADMLVPAAAKTSAASDSAIGMNACKTVGSNWVPPLWSRRAIASVCARPCR